MSDREDNKQESTFHTEAGTIVFDKTPSAAEKYLKAREEEAHQFQRDLVKSNKRIALFNGLLVFATFCTIFVGIWQGIISQKAANAARDAAIAASGSLQQTQQQTNLNRDLVRGTNAATITLGFGPPINQPEFSPGMVFINRGVFPAEKFSGIVELQCENLISRKILSTNQTSFGGADVFISKENAYSFIPVAPKGCDTLMPFAQSTRGLIRKIKYTYLNGMGETSSGNLCDEYVQMKYLPDPVLQPDAILRSDSGWHSCADIPAILRGAIIPFDTNKKWVSANYRKQHPESN